MNINLIKNKPAESNDYIEKMRSDMRNGKKTVAFSIRLPRDLHTEFRKKTFLAHTSMKDVVVKAIKDYLKEKS